VSPDELQRFAEATGPFLPVIGVVVGGVVVGLFAIHNRRRGAIEGKIPTVAEAWDEARKAQKERDDYYLKLSTARAALDAMLSLFRDYVARVKRGGTTALNPAEQAALNLPVPAGDEDWPTITPQQLDELRP